MLQTVSHIINCIFENGIVDKATSREFLGNALSLHIGQSLDPEAVMDSLLLESAWTQESQERIRSVLRSFEGVVLCRDDHSAKDLSRKPTFQDTE